MVCYMIKFCLLLPRVFNKTKFAETVVRLGPTVSETMKRKLINGHGILEIGGFKRFFWKIFSVEKDKKHLKAASPCFFFILLKDFVFWFMGFVNYQKSFNYVQQAIYRAQNPL